jgi:hypothetical protein
MAKQMPSNRKRMRRDMAKESHWRKHVAAQEESGLAVHAYCQGAGLSESCFYWWKREIAKRDREAHASRPKQPTPVRFAEIRVIEGSREGACCEDPVKPTDAPKPDPIDESKSESIDGPKFVPLNGPESDSADTAAGVEIFLSGGRRLRVLPNFDEPTLLRVVALLDGARPC